MKRDSARVHADTPASEIRRFPPSGFDLRLDGSVAVSGRIPKVLASTAVAPESRLEFAANRAENPIEKGRFTHVWTWFAATLDVKHGESV